MENNTIQSDLSIPILQNFSGNVPFKDHNHFMQGWECPRCGKINAPWKGSCDCIPEEKSNWHDLPGDVWNPGGLKIEDYPKVVYTANEIDPCEHCSNNPKNGGSGYCNCTLGERDKVTC